MKRLCFGTLMNILYQARNPKVTNASLCNAIFSAYLKDVQNYDGSVPGHLKSGRINVPPDIMESARITSSEFAANKIKIKLIPLINADKQKLVVLAIKDVLRNDKNIADTSIIGYEKGYEKENILNNTTFNFGDLLASVFYYAIVQISNKSCAEEIKEISKDFVDGFRTSTEEIYFSSEEVDKSIPLRSTLNDTSFKNVFEKICSQKIDELSNPSTVQIYGPDITNFRLRFDRLKNYLIDNISGYVLSREDLNRLKQTNIGAIESRAIVKFISAYTQSSNTTLAELLLYVFLEQELGAPKIMTKIELGNGIQASKSDGVHLLVTHGLREPFRQLVFGASTIIGDLNSAVDHAFAKIIDIEKNHTNEVQMVSNTIYRNIFDKDTSHYIADLFLPSKTKLPVPEMAFGIFLGYTISVDTDGIDNNSSYRAAIKEKMRQDIQKLQAYIKQKIRDEKLGGYNFYVYVIPFNDADVERTKIIDDMIQGR